MFQLLHGFWILKFLWIYRFSWYPIYQNPELWLAYREATIVFRPILVCVVGLLLSLCGRGCVYLDSWASGCPGWWWGCLSFGFLRFVGAWQWSPREFAVPIDSLCPSPLFVWLFKVTSSWFVRDVVVSCVQDFSAESLGHGWFPGLVLLPRGRMTS